MKAEVTMLISKQTSSQEVLAEIESFIITNEVIH
jgi:hypothetical protein